MQFITTLDLANGYWQEPLNGEDREKTAFICPKGLYQFMTMPFGLSGASATFQQLMDSIERHRCVFLESTWTTLLFTVKPGRTTSTTWGKVSNDSRRPFDSEDEVCLHSQRWCILRFQDWTRRSEARGQQLTQAILAITQPNTIKTFRFSWEWLDTTGVLSGTTPPSRNL